MDTQSIVLIIGAGWLLIGLVLAVAMGRRGHSAFSWGLMGALLGPFALVLATEAVLDERTAHRAVLDPGVPRLDTGISVLAGIDGSPEAAAALDAATAMLGPQLGRLTLAGVVDFDHIGETERHIRAELDRQAAVLRERAPHYELASAPAARARCGVVVLTGQPAEVLAREAIAGGYDLLVVGARGRGLANSLLGSVASQLAAGAPVPVLVGPSTSSSPLAASAKRTGGGTDVGA